jgi:hypothetical protein
MAWHLMRTWYATDATDAEPEYRGAFSGTIPDSAFWDDRRIVNIDWSERGQVEVTFLVRGEGLLADGNG